MFLCLVMVFTTVFAPVEASAASNKTIKSIKLNVKNKKAMYVGMKQKNKTAKLSVNVKTSKLKFTSNQKKVAIVTNKGVVSGELELTYIGKLQK